MARKKEEIQQEYGNLCAQLGEKQFQIEILKAQIDEGNSKIMSLGKEMDELMQELSQKTPSQPNPSPLEVKNEAQG